MSSRNSVIRQEVFKRGHAEEWTRERIGKLSAQDIKQLRANAERLNEPALALLCTDVLKTLPRAGAAPRSKPQTKAG